jgi:ferritin-like metal-binding protein YciE
MKNTSTASKKSATGAPAKKSAAPGKSSSSAKGGDVKSKLKKLLVDELKDIYWAENALTKALPKMAKKATSPELKEALEKHLEETKGQIERLDQVFVSIGEKSGSKKCEAMAGLIKEADEIMTDTDAGMMRDAGIISAGQKVEHYEIATYGTLRQFATTLGYDEAAELLGETLDQEKAADEKLTEVAESAINVGAADEEEG